MTVAVIIPAAGLGTRMRRDNGTSRKQFMQLDGQPILIHTLRKFAAVSEVNEIVIAVREDDVDWVHEMLRGETLAKPVRVVQGGDSRQQSVERAFAALTPGADLVAVHDAVRPFIDIETIAEVCKEAARSGAAIVGVVPVDTVKEVRKAQAGHAKIRTTIPRERLVLAQTPQVFKYEVLGRAFAKATEDGFIGTDEASLVERLEIEVSVVLGSDRNIKITKPTDMALARMFLEQEMAPQGTAGQDLV